MPLPTHRTTSADTHAPTSGAIPRGAMEPTAELHLQLPCDRDAPAAVRDALRRLDGLRWVIADAMLVASELVSNAVVHSGAAEDDLLGVDVTLGEGRLLISVCDPGTSGRIATPRPGKDPFGGLGLRLVEQLSERWGSDRDDGQRVWAELAVPKQTGRGPAAGAL
jgi:anti-sigma regulatory factor (Ser/Thr protein kinase)